MRCPVAVKCKHSQGPEQQVERVTTVLQTFQQAMQSKPRTCSTNCHRVQISTSAVMKFAKTSGTQ